MKDKIINTIVEKITSEVKVSLGIMSENQDKKFEMVIEHLEKLRLELSSLDQRLTQKEMRDKMDYGQTQYKISSLQNELKETAPKKKKPLDKSH
jgi:hypothetical protein